MKKRKRRKKKEKKEKTTTWDCHKDTNLVINKKM
jgi:hypothetical protein